MRATTDRPPPIGFQDTVMNGAALLSDYLLQERSKQVLGTEIFGVFTQWEVLARADLDFIVLVDDETHNEWLELLERRNTGRLDAREVRKEAAVDALDIFYSTLGDVCGGVASAHLNFFLFPVDWRDRLDELQKVLGGGDPMFMANIVRDALVYDRKEGYFTRMW